MLHNSKINTLSLLGTKSPKKGLTAQAMNPCPCGFLGHPLRPCRCSPDQIGRYQGKISGPLLDRIDMQIKVGALTPQELLTQATGEPSANIAVRVGQASAIQLKRQGHDNNRLTASTIDLHCTPDEAGQQLLQHTMQRLNWSARACHRTLKIARTIADLAQAPSVHKAHVAEAIQYRRALKAE